MRGLGNNRNRSFYYDEKKIFFCVNYKAQTENVQKDEVRKNMKKLLLMVFLFVFSAGFAHAADKNVQNANLAGKKILIAYFSWSGNTEHIAKLIRSWIGGDMFKIETAVPYPDDYQETAYGIAKKQHENNVMPELKDNGNISGYDIIFVGTPAWWYHMAPAVKTFLSAHTFEGKTIVPFITHGGGGRYEIPADMGKLAKGAKVLSAFDTLSDGGANVEQEIIDWLNNL